MLPNNIYVATFYPDVDVEKLNRLNGEVFETEDDFDVWMQENLMPDFMGWYGLTEFGETYNKGKINPQDYIAIFQINQRR